MPVPIWQTGAGPYVFHHTTPEAAQLIAESGPFRVGKSDLLGPTGIHAGSDDPEAVTLEWVRATYFFNLWPLEALGGVVVFAADDPLQPFEQLAPNVWVLPAPPGPLDVADIVVGWGEQGPDGEWTWSAGLMA